MKGEALFEYKKAQKKETEGKLIKAIKELKSSNNKISVSKIATLSGVSRANIYANYMYVFDDVDSVTSMKKKERQIEESIEQKTKKESKVLLKEKDEIITKLREENKQLRHGNGKLIDEIIALKINCTTIGGNEIN